jgi:hypothetical protein
MRKQLAAFITISLIACAAAPAHASDETQQPMLRGVAYSKCTNITKVRGTDIGQLEIEAFVGGWITAMNVLFVGAGMKGHDIADGASVREISEFVFDYCAHHKASQGVEAMEDYISTLEVPQQ